MIVEEWWKYIKKSGKCNGQQQQEGKQSVEEDRKNRNQVGTDVIAQITLWFASMDTHHANKQIKNKMVKGDFAIKN